MASAVNALLLATAPAAINLALAGTASAQDNASTLTFINNGNTSNEWLTNTVTPSWVQLDLGSNKIVTRYYINAANGNVTRTPITWVLKGSTTGVFGGEEVTLDTQTSVSAWSALERRGFTIASPGSYRYYRMTMSNTTAGTGVGNIYYFTEWELWG